MLMNLRHGVHSIFISAITADCFGFNDLIGGNVALN